ncbi:unnamed protein product [Anisakis simplex]|uniref:TOG domain-containing protein n=1 Tax=Anisakis simplex TaxID=6269 RepID=A0A0M3KCP1_ANISI|nr:unnamed protein product [Anisakis simplex]
MVASKQWKDRLKALEDLNGIITKSERLSSKEDYGEIVVTLAKVLAKDVNVNVAAMSTKCLKGLANGIRFKFSPFASLVMKSALQKFKEKKTVLREPLIELVDSIAVITPLSSYVDEVSAAMAQVNPQIKSQTALFMARLLKQHNAKTFPDQFNSLAPQINKLTTDPDTEVRDASYCLLGAAMKSLTERQMNALFSDIVNDNIRMAKASCAFVKEQHAKVVEECGDAASDAILKLLKATDSTETTAATKNVSKSSEGGKDSARKPATAIGHNKRPQQNTRAQDQHLARMMAARKGGGTPKTNISSSVSTPHLSAHPRRASSSINRAVSPLTNGNATQTPQQYNFASGPRKMPSAGDIRHNVASAPQSARSHHVVMTSQARGVEEHIARLAQRRAAEQSKAQNKDYRSRVRNPSAGRSVPQNATTSGYSSARGAGDVFQDIRI